MSKLKAALLIAMIVLFSAFIGFIFGTHSAPVERTQSIRVWGPPHCQEDEVLVGVGDFSDGRWAEYICGPALDDFRVGE